MKLQPLMSDTVGRDLTFKVFVYIARLTHVYSFEGSDLSKNSKALSDAMTDTRMLINLFRVISSSRDLQKSYLRAVWTPETIANFFSVFFRAFEQISGDLGYVIRHDMLKVASLSRERVSWHYKFYKSWSLVLGALASLLSIHKAQRERTAESQRRSRSSLVSFIRCCCDMFIYFSWIESYKPNVTIAHLCGLTSGVLGVYQVVMA